MVVLFLWTFLLSLVGAVAVRGWVVVVELVGCVVPLRQQVVAVRWNLLRRSCLVNLFRLLLVLVVMVALALLLGPVKGINLFLVR